MTTKPLLEYLGSNDDVTLPRDLRVVVVGAGISGIAIGARLLQVGIEDLTILEKAPAAGGTWWYNRYPGAACDFNAHHYSFTFKRNPDFSSTNPPAAELNAYLDEVIDTIGLRTHITFGKEVVRSAYEDGEWQIATRDGEIYRADVLISGVGFLHIPNVPRFPGLENFAGTVFHSSQWPHELDLKGKRIANIGNGSTSAQIVPAIVDEVEIVTVFQRTAQWVWPVPKRPYTDEERRAFRDYPEALEQVYAEQEKQVIETFGHGVMGDEAILASIESACQEYLDTTVTDPVLKAALQPHYPVACKRLIMAAGYYEALVKPAADVVTEPIARFTSTGIETADGTMREFDVVVFSTGFRTHEYARPLGLEGPGGLTLEQAWAEGARSFEATTLAGFPNFFMMGGPYSAVGNYSFITSAELQATHIIRLLDLRTKKGAKAIAPKAESQNEFATTMLRRSQTTVWQSGCNSWYLDAHGKTDIWAGTPEQYLEMFASGPHEDDFVFEFDNPRTGALQRSPVAG